ncbi:MAG: hypothetical protein H7Y20_04960 [Bryobacteraceae bacterium]|nr:hypothetical protein [Bryobacteraceae bacterium]
MTAQRLALGMAGAWLWSVTAGLAQESPSSDLLQRLDRTTKERSRLPHTAVHRYVLDNSRLGKHASIDLQVTCNAVGRCRVEVLHEEGSEAMRKRVLSRLSAAYKQATQDESGTSMWQMTPGHYDFTPLPSSVSEAGTRRFRIRPRKGSSGGLEGTVWVSCSDAQIVRFEGHMLRRPSFWVARPVLTQIYRKKGRYWFLERVEGYAESPWIGTSKFMLTVMELDVSSPTNRSVSLQLDGADCIKTTARELDPFPRSAIGASRCTDRCGARK